MKTEPFQRTSWIGSSVRCVKLLDVGSPRIYHPGQRNYPNNCVFALFINLTNDEVEQKINDGPSVYVFFFTLKTRSYGGSLIGAVAGMNGRKSPVTWSITLDTAPTREREPERD